MKSNIDWVKSARVVGLIDLGKNNGDNPFGWSGLKAVINKEDELFILDFPEEARITTNDGLLIKEGNEAWLPSMDDIMRYDLFLFARKDY
ncbi:MAG: hypothetical protein Q8J69_04080 [Sphingobacteriaceae bacterium]|nr:hypothetical protein [Sphingobacteriaceae bacterium]